MVSRNRFMGGVVVAGIVIVTATAAFGCSSGGGIAILLHEFGHAFGLSDTYVEGVWTCAADQPEAVMCHNATPALRADDIRGVRYEYCKRTGRCDAGAYADAYGGGGGAAYRR